MFILNVGLKTNRYIYAFSYFFLAGVEVHRVLKIHRILINWYYLKGDVLSTLEILKGKVNVTGGVCTIRNSSASSDVNPAKLCIQTDHFAFKKCVAEVFYSTFS